MVATILVRRMAARYRAAGARPGPTPPAHLPTDPSIRPPARTASIEACSVPPVRCPASGAGPASPTSAAASRGDGAGRARRGPAPGGARRGGGDARVRAQPGDRQVPRGRGQHRAAAGAARDEPARSGQPARRGSARRSARAGPRAPMARSSLRAAREAVPSSSRWRSVGTPAMTQRTARRSNSSSSARCQASSRESGLAGQRLRVLAPGARGERAAQREHVALGVRVVVPGAAAGACSAPAGGGSACPRSGRVGGPFELAAHVAGDRLGVARPGGRRLQRGELADARARLLGVVVVDRRRAGAARSRGPSMSSV